MRWVGAGASAVPLEELNGIIRKTIRVRRITLGVFLALALAIKLFLGISFDVALLVAPLAWFLLTFPFQYLMERPKEAQAIHRIHTGFFALELLLITYLVHLIDVALPGLSGLEATKQIKKRAPKARIIILSIYDDEEYVQKARCCGADAFLSKGCTPEALIDAIHRVHRGECLLKGFEGDRGQAHLTPREKEVLALIAMGKTNKEIAALLGISPKTVEAHRAHLMGKLGIHTAAGLTRYALAKGLSK